MRRKKSAGVIAEKRKLLRSKSVFPAKHTILSPFGGENSVFRVGKIAGLSSYEKGASGFEVRRQR